MGFAAQIMAALIIVMFTALLWILSPLQALAFQIGSVQSPLVVAFISSKGDAGTMDAAHGGLTGPRGHQTKGNAKLLQASAMKAIADFKQIIKEFPMNLKAGACARKSR
jgi:hypothetical protein